MWKILICSEDRDFMQDLGHRIRRLAGERLKEIRLFSNKEDLDFYTTGRPEESDIILIDISRDNGGIQLAQKILAVQPHSQIIFMSSTDKYYLDVYSVDHVYFLKKPIEAVFLMKALNKAGSRLQDMKKSYLVISNKQGIYKIPLYTILCFESEKRKIHVYTQERKLSYYGKFEDLMEKLDPRFARCHNSYIVNLTKVRELSDKKFVCENGKNVPISKTYYVDVREKFLSYLDGGEFCGGTPLGAHS